MATLRSMILVQSVHWCGVILAWHWEMDCRQDSWAEDIVHRTNIIIESQRFTLLMLKVHPPYYISFTEGINSLTSPSLSIYQKSLRFYPIHANPSRIYSHTSIPAIPSLRNYTQYEYNHQASTLYVSHVEKAPFLLSIFPARR